MPTMYVPNDIWLNPINRPDEEPTHCALCYESFHHTELEYYEPEDEHICSDCKHEEETTRILDAHEYNT